MKMYVKPEERVALLKRLVKSNQLHILFWDTESSLNEGYWFNSNKPQYMSYRQIKAGKETKIISIQYMWEGEEVPKYLTWDVVNGNFDDSSMIEEFITNVMRRYPEKETLMVCQNNVAFDDLLLNERAKYLRLTPPLYNNIKVDTYKRSKQSFKSSSHSLDHRSQQYNLGGKLHTDLNVWVDIQEGKTQPEDVLIPYGLKDVLDLQAIFWNDLPYYSKLPALLESLLSMAHTKCEQCEKRHKPKYNLKECVVKGKKGWECLNCNNRFI